MNPLLRLEVTCAVIAHWAAVAAAQVTVIKAGRLVAPETGTVSENQLIVVEGERVEAVGADLDVPEGARCSTRASRPSATWATRATTPPSTSRGPSPGGWCLGRPWSRPGASSP